MSQDSGERTEKATPQRMKDVRSKGKLSRSQDLTAWLGKRASAGSMAPRGFPRDNKFN